MNRKIKSNFYTEIAAMLDSGMLLSDALKISSIQLQLKDDRLSQTVASGTPLSAAMRKLPKVFMRQEWETIRAGEDSGKLTLCLKNLAKWCDLMDQTKRETVNGLIYPAIILHLAPILLGLPELVRSGCLECYILSIIIGLAPLWILVTLWFYALPMARSNSRTIAQTVDTLSLKIPIAGEAIRKLELSRFFSTLAFALEAGVGIHQSLSLAGRSCSNLIIKKDLSAISKQIRNGSTLTAACRDIRHFDSVAKGFLLVGEQTGRNDQMLHKLYSHYFSAFQTTMARFSKVAPVAVFLVVAAVIGIRIVRSYQAL